MENVSQVSPKEKRAATRDALNIQEWTATKKMRFSLQMHWRVIKRRWTQVARQVNVIDSGDISYQSADGKEQ